MNHQVYQYHIIATNPDIEKELSNIGCYPYIAPRIIINNVQNAETAETQNEVFDIDEFVRRWFDDDLRPGDSEGNLGEDNGSREEIQHYDGNGTMTGRSGITNVQFSNGGTRRYSAGGGSAERMGAKDDYKLHCSSGVGTYNELNQKSSCRIYDGPWKLVTAHKGTCRPHWHFMYIGRTRHWGDSSRIGNYIRRGAYKCETISCIPCLRKYLYSGNGLQVLQDILTARDIEACICANHRLGVEGDSGRQEEIMQNECTSWGDAVYEREGVSSRKIFKGMVDTVDETDVDQDANVLQSRDNSLGIESERFESLLETSHKRVHNRLCGSNDNGTRVLLLCKERAFTEGEALICLSKSPEGIGFMLSAGFSEQIRKIITDARILVFQETIKARFERAKLHCLERDATANDEIQIMKTRTKLEDLLNANNINAEEFANTTFDHLNGNLKDKNNLLFRGPPSTGKTMIMQSLVDCQFNYARLTGLTTNSSFNFSGLLYCNACFMDGCKLRENQFEQWQLLASGSPMTTNVKYKGRCLVSDCVLYTCSSYSIDMFCSVPGASRAVETSTAEYFFSKQVEKYFEVTPFVWENFWREVIQKTL